MGIFKRTRDIISANLNDLVDRFEDPDKMLRHAVREMESSIATATAAAARSIAAEKLLAAEHASHERQAAEWRDRAKGALASGDEQLALGALRRRREHEHLAAALSEQLAAAAGASASLRRQIEAMKAKLAEAKRKRLALSARLKAADARRRWQGAGCQETRYDGGSLFDRMSERVAEAEAEANAHADLSGEEEQLVAQTIDPGELDSELEALRRELSAT